MARKVEVCFVGLAAAVIVAAALLHSAPAVEASSAHRSLLGGSDSKCYYDGTWTDSGDWYTGPTHTCKCDDGDWKYCQPKEDDDDSCYDPSYKCDYGYELEVCDTGKVCVKYVHEDSEYYCEGDGWKVDDDGDKCTCVKVIYKDPQYKCDSGWSLEKDSYGNYKCEKKYEKEPEYTCGGW